MTCEEVIRLALRRIHERPGGVLAPVDEPTAGEYDAALADLQSLYDGWVSSGMFGRAVDIQISAAHEMEEGERVFNATDDPVAITLPESLTDPVTGEARPPRDYTLARVAGAAPQTYIWSAPKGAWDKMTSLALTDAAPLAERGSNGLAANLAETMVGPGALSPGVRSQSVAFRSLLSLKFDRPRVSARPDYF